MTTCADCGHELGDVTARHTFGEGIEVAICADHLSNAGRSWKERAERIQAMRKYALAFGSKDAGSVAVHRRAAEKAAAEESLPAVLDSGLEDTGLLTGSGFDEGDE